MGLRVVNYVTFRGRIDAPQARQRKRRSILDVDSQRAKRLRGYLQTVLDVSLRSSFRHNVPSLQCSEILRNRRVLAAMVAVRLEGHPGCM